jgi:hypothetical protein
MGGTVLATTLMTKNKNVSIRLAPWRWCFAMALLSLGANAAAWAHIGPPYPIMQDRKIGPMTVTVWSNPDVGIGSFYIIVDPPKGTSVPGDMKVQVAVQPISGRLPENSYSAWREKLFDRVEFKTMVPFDKEETWRIRVLLSSTQVSGETDTDVQVTPTLLGRWSLLLYLLPFLGIGFLWFKAVSTKLKKRKRAQQRARQSASL